MPEKLAVLVIDESAEHRLLVASVLAANGYEVVSAADASSAVEELGRREFAVILLDLKLPHNGVAFIDYLGDAMPEVLARTIVFTPRVDRPIFGVLPKPFRLDALVKTVTECAVQHDS